MKNNKALSELRSFRRKIKKEIKKQKGKPSLVNTYTRAKALIAYYEGISLEVVAQCYDVSKKSLQRWVQCYQTYGGVENLRDGERSGAPSKLPEEKQKELVQLIQKDNHRIWVARHVYQLLMINFEVAYSVKYLPEFLRKIGLSFHKAVHNLVKKDSEKRRKWIQEQLPKIYKEKIEKGWIIFYQDEVGFASEGTLGYTWGIKGKKTEVPNYGRHGRVNLIGAFELGNGKFYGVITSFKVNATRFRRFIYHLKREMKQDKILLICDNASFHKAKWFTEWAQEQESWLKLEFLPPYSPDFNPIERLWRWMKTDFFHNQCWKSAKQLKKYLSQVVDELEKGMHDLSCVMKKENERFQGIADYYEIENIPIFNSASIEDYVLQQKKRAF